MSGLPFSETSKAWSRTFSEGFEVEAEREADGILGVVAYELRHGAFHGGGEAESLALAWQNTNNTADSREEAHVEHAVGFIEDERLDAAQRD